MTEPDEAAYAARLRHAATLAREAARTVVDRAAKEADEYLAIALSHDEIAERIEAGLHG